MKDFKKILCLVLSLFTLLLLFSSCRAENGEEKETTDEEETEEVGTEGLLYAPLPDGTYAVEVGTAKYLDEIFIPSTYRKKPITKIPDGAFAESEFKSIRIPDSITTIGDSAFRDCNALQSVTLPDSVTSIGTSAFENCTALVSFLLANSVQSIGPSAFRGCKSLASVKIGGGVQEIGDCAFSECPNLASISVSRENTKYIAKGNCLIDKQSKTLVLGCPDSVLPTDGSVTGIGKNAFSACEGLQKIVIPDSVTRIEDAAFQNCEELTEIVLPEHLTTIGDNAFRGTSLEKITLGKKVSAIGKDAFYACRWLKSVTMENSVTRIDDTAFYACSQLTDLYFTGSQQEWNAIEKGYMVLSQSVTIHYHFVPSIE